ncbi:MAG: hypothetical protein Q9216_005640, partial [Gyalolechia sp. 2 TL-2023]
MRSSSPSPALRASTLCLLLLCLILNPTATLAAITGQGSVSTWSDSSCADPSFDTYAFSEPRVIELNHTLPANSCHNLARTAHSYRVDFRPLCDDGSEADFNYYTSADCPVEETRSLGSAGLGGGGGGEFDTNGLCLALVAFDSFQFFCEGGGGGVGGGDDATSIEPAAPVVTSRSDLVVGPTDLPTVPSFTDLVIGPTEPVPPSPVVTSRSDLVVGPTPLPPGSSFTAPPYTVLDTSGYTLAPTPTATGGTVKFADATIPL